MRQSKSVQQSEEANTQVLRSAIKWSNKSDKWLNGQEEAKQIKSVTERGWQKQQSSTVGTNYAAKPLGLRTV